LEVKCLCSLRLVLSDVLQKTCVFQIDLSSRCPFGTYEILPADNLNLLIMEAERLAVLPGCPKLSVQQGFTLTPEAASPLFLAALGWFANANEE
jgi:hypothetical protein